MIEEQVLINKEWLITKGFAEYKDDSGSEYHLRVNRDLYFIYCDDFSLAIGDSVDNCPVIPSLSVAIYTHQFENIYYCLTGKKL